MNDQKEKIDLNVTNGMRQSAAQRSASAALVSTAGVRPAIDKNLLDSCIHCGLCLPACPTYLATGREMESPRGRIYLMSQWQSGAHQLTDRMAGHIESCLGCLGCQTACPSGVKYEEILNQSRPYLAERRGKLARFFMRFAFKELLPRYWLLRLMGILMRAWQVIFGRNVLRRIFRSAPSSPPLIRPALSPSVPSAPPLIETGAPSPSVSQPIEDSAPHMASTPGAMPGSASEARLNAAPRAIHSLPAPKTMPAANASLISRLCDWEAFTPEVPLQVPLPVKVLPMHQRSYEESQARSTAEMAGAQYHAALFCGCVMDIFYNHVNHACIRLMLIQGHSVEVPRQTCCGALAYHAGEIDIAIKLAKRNIDYFRKSGSPIVVTSAGCGAMLKHYGHLLKNDRDYAHGAEVFSGRVQDITEFLARNQFTNDPKPLAARATYHAACHLAHAQNVRKEPLELLERLDTDPEHDLVPLIEQEHCCGSAGIYNLLNTRLSLKVLDRKLDFIEKTGAKTVITTNPGCMLQLEAGIKARGLDVDVKHLAQALDEAYSDCETI